MVCTCAFNKGVHFSTFRLSLMMTATMDTIVARLKKAIEIPKHEVCMCLDEYHHDNSPTACMPKIVVITYE